MTRPETTLFMLTSVDGKINSGDSDVLDVDRDWSRIKGIKEGLKQYYDLEKQTDLCSFNTGRVMAKIGANDWLEPRPRVPASFVIVDNQPHLTKRGVENMIAWGEHIYLVTTNNDHPAKGMESDRLTVIGESSPINFSKMFERLKERFGISNITIQSGGKMNAALLRLGLIDHVSFVVAPLIVGGDSTPGVVGGEAIHNLEELSRIRPLKLISCDILEHSYIHVRYDVMRGEALLG